MSIISELLQAVPSAATAIGVFLAARQVQLTKKIAQTQFEDGLTQQYSKLHAELPINVFFQNGAGVCLDADELERCLPIFLQYFELTNQQIFLKDQKRVSPETWRTWRSGIRANFALPSFAMAWSIIEGKVMPTYKELRELLKEPGFFKDPRVDEGKK